MLRCFGYQIDSDVVRAGGVSFGGLGILATGVVAGVLGSAGFRYELERVENDRKVSGILEGVVMSKVGDVEYL